MYISTSIAYSELRTLARGEKSNLPIQVIAQFLLDCRRRGAAPAPKPGIKGNSLQFLRALGDVKLLV
jgi:hypothetical protein